MKLRLLLLLALLIGFTACKKDDDEAFEIRIKNNSQYVFDDFYIDTSGGSHNYGTIQPDSYSEYAQFNFGYKFAFTKFYINGDEFSFTPVDYVGEQQFYHGKWAYIITINDYNSRAFAINFVRQD